MGGEMKGEISNQLNEMRLLVKIEEWPRWHDKCLLELNQLYKKMDCKRSLNMYDFPYF